MNALYAFDIHFYSGSLKFYKKIDGQETNAGITCKKL